MKSMTNWLDEHCVYLSDLTISGICKKRNTFGGSELRICVCGMVLGLWI